jgi:hypothetical protein
MQKRLEYHAHIKRWKGAENTLRAEDEGDLVRILLS